MNDLEIEIVRAENAWLRLKLKWFQQQFRSSNKSITEEKIDGRIETSFKETKEEKEEINGVPDWP